MAAGARNDLNGVWLLACKDNSERSSTTINSITSISANCISALHQRSSDVAAFTQSGRVCKISPNDRPKGKIPPPWGNVACVKRNGTTKMATLVLFSYVRKSFLPNFRTGSSVPKACNTRSLSVSLPRLMKSYHMNSLLAATGLAVGCISLTCGSAALAKFVDLRDTVFFFLSAKHAFVNTYMVSC